MGRGGVKERDRAARPVPFDRNPPNCFRVVNLPSVFPAFLFFRLAWVSSALRGPVGKEKLPRSSQCTEVPAEGRARAMRCNDARTQMKKLTHGQCQSAREKERIIIDLYQARMVARLSWWWFLAPLVVRRAVRHASPSTESSVVDVKEDTRQTPISPSAGARARARVCPARASSSRSGP